VIALSLDESSDLFFEYSFLKDLRLIGDNALGFYLSRVIGWTLDLGDTEQTRRSEFAWTRILSNLWPICDFRDFSSNFATCSLLSMNAPVKSDFFLFTGRWGLGVVIFVSD
jgi:hypothetical protein